MLIILMCDSLFPVSVNYVTAIGTVGDDELMWISCRLCLISWPLKWYFCFVIWFISQTDCRTNVWTKLARLKWNAGRRSWRRRSGRCGKNPSTSRKPTRRIPTALQMVCRAVSWQIFVLGSVKSGASVLHLLFNAESFLRSLCHFVILKLCVFQIAIH